jgi:hypothetical protein
MRDGAESKTRPSNFPDINLNQSELTRDTYLVRVNPHTGCRIGLRDIGFYM